MKKRLLILGMLLCIVNVFTACTAEELDTEPQAVQLNMNNEQANIDPKK